MSEDRPERAKILASLIDSEAKAWEALSGYKFWMFGYHAARWVNYNMLLPTHERLRSPFKILVQSARDRVEAIEQRRPLLEVDAQLSLPTQIGSEGDGA